LSYSAAFHDTGYTEFSTSVYIAWLPAKWRAFWCSHEQSN